MATLAPEQREHRKARHARTHGERPEQQISLGDLPTRDSAQEPAERPAVLPDAGTAPVTSRRAVAAPVAGHAVRLELRDLRPDPRAEWTTLLRFVGWSAADRDAVLQCVEPLVQAGTAMVADTYAYLARFPETAAVLGWEDHVDPASLAERRRFFTVWLTRTLSLDTSDEFALALFRGGRFHAGQGPRRADVPSSYVTTSVGLVLSAFAQTLDRAHVAPPVALPALGAWSRYLSVQLHLMLLGDAAARDLSDGPWRVRCAVYAHLRPLVGARVVTVHAGPGSTAGDVLRKLFGCYPLLRDAFLEREWESRSRSENLWEEEVPVYVPGPGRRVLHNGRDLQFEAGAATPVADGDTLALFPHG